MNYGISSTDLWNGYITKCFPCSPFHIPQRPLVHVEERKTETIVPTWIRVKLRKQKTLGIELKITKQRNIRKNIFLLDSINNFDFLILSQFMSMSIQSIYQARIQEFSKGGGVRSLTYIYMTTSARDSTSPKYNLKLYKLQLLG